MNPAIHSDRTAYRDHPSWNNSVSGQERLQDLKGRHYVVGHANVEDEELACLLLTAGIKDLFTDISTMTISLTHFGHEFVRSADICRRSLSLYIHVPAIAWTCPWSIEQLGSALQGVVSTREVRGVSANTKHAAFTGRFEIRFKRRWRTSCTVQEHLRPAFDAACSMVDDAIANLTAGINGSVLMAVFRFPSEISLPCEQYLLYFAQYLRELDIESSAEIRHQADQILFRVVPATGPEAL